MIYDTNSCLIRSNEQEDKETWSKQELLAYKASTDPDTMYHHQAMKQPDREKFQEAMRKVCEGHYKEGNYRLVKRSELQHTAASEWNNKTLSSDPNTARYGICDHLCRMSHALDIQDVD